MSLCTLDISEQFYCILQHAKKRKKVEDKNMAICGKVLVAGGAAGVASVKRHQELPAYQTDPDPADSKTDPLLAKTEPISDCSRASDIKHSLKKETTTLQQQLGDRS